MNIFYIEVGSEDMNFCVIIKQFLVENEEVGIFTKINHKKALFGCKNYWKYNWDEWLIYNSIGR